MPGDHIKMVVELVQRVVIEKKMCFAIREGGHTVENLLKPNLLELHVTFWTTCP